MTDDTRTHDYRDQRWGHAVRARLVDDDGRTIDIDGHGTGIRAGDYLLLQNGSGETRYQVSQIEYERDPLDMFFGRATFAPRAAP